MIFQKATLATWPVIPSGQPLFSPSGLHLAVKKKIYTHTHANCMLCRQGCTLGGKHLWQLLTNVVAAGPPRCPTLTACAWALLLGQSRLDWVEGREAQSHPGCSFLYIVENWADLFFIIIEFVSWGLKVVKAGFQTMLSSFKLHQFNIIPHSIISLTPQHSHCHQIQSFCEVCCWVGHMCGLKLGPLLV